jgi:adenosylcobinamide-GDP ribazoletransferase
MRDERTGHGLAGGALMLLILFSALNAVEVQRWEMLLVAPVLGRWAMTLAVVVFPYAGGGPGSDIRTTPLAQAIIATVTMLIIVERSRLCVRTSRRLRQS